MSKELEEAIMWKRLAGVKAALEAGADPNLKIGKRPALIQAIWRKSKPIALMLLEAGADPNAVDKEKQPALHWVAERLRDPGLARRLIEAGAKVDALDGVQFKGYAPLHYAVKNLKFVQFLVEHGAPLDQRSGHEQKTPLHLLCESESGDMNAVEMANALWFIKQGADINAQTRKKETPLHLAAASSGGKVIKALLAKKARLTEDAHGNTALHYAIGAYRKDPATWAALLAAGCNIDHQNGAGRTPLMEATGDDNAVAVKFLLGKGANPAIQNDQGQTALEYARKYEYRKVLPLLEKASSSKVKSGARAARAKR